LFYWKYHFNFTKLSDPSILPTGFQSLFYWKYHFNAKFHNSSGMHLHVSILVLLEVPLQRTCLSIRFSYSFCFNPCFTGSTTSTVCMSDISTMYLYVSILVLLEVPLQPLSFHKNYLTKKQVSILVLLEVPLQRLYICCESSLIGVFQSLFYWKYHFNTIWIFCLRRDTACFNPCFTGSTTSTQIDYITKRRKSMFQSLFYWKYHFNCTCHFITPSG